MVHHLEPPLQGLVGLEVFLVFVQRGGADGAELAAGQGRLQDVGRVHRAGGASRTHERMDLVDEQDDLAGGVHDLLHDALQPLFEFTLVFRARDEGAHVQGVHLPPDDRVELALGGALVEVHCEPLQKRVFVICHSCCLLFARRVCRNSRPPDRANGYLQTLFL